MSVAWARGSGLETSFPYGVVRQLLEPVLVDADDNECPVLSTGAARFAAPLFDYSSGEFSAHQTIQDQQVLHGLYWACVNLSRVRPLVILVDDLRWTDAPSLRFLHYLAGRLDDSAILLATTTGPRADWPTGAAGAMGLMFSATILRLGPLTPAGVCQVLEHALGAAPDPQLAQLCHTATGGNQFILHEVVAELIAADPEPTGSDLLARSQLMARVVSRSVLRWLGRLSPQSIALAEAASVLGMRPDPWQAAAVAGLAETDVVPAVGALVEAGILHREAPTRFADPLVQKAIYQHLPAGRSQRMHAEAARILEAAGAAVTEVAAHLVQAPAAGDSHRAAVLREAGEMAMEQGDPATAALLLRRALREPPPECEVPSLLAELGRAELRCREPQAIKRLWQALSLAGNPDLRARVGLELAAALIGAARHEDAIVLLRQLAVDLDGCELAPELTVQLNGTLISVVQQASHLHPVAVRELGPIDEHAGQPGTHGRRIMQTHRAVEALRSGADAASVLAMARAAFGDGPGAFVDDFGAHSACMTAVLLAICGQLAEADRMLTDILLHARQHRMLLTGDAATGLRAWVRYACGRLDEAEADARASLRDLQPDRLPAMGVPFAAGALVGVLMARDELDQAHQFLADQGFFNALPKAAAFAPLPLARGQLRLATDQCDEGIVDLLHGCDLLYEWCAPPLSVVPAAEAAVALARAGRSERAAVLVEENLCRAREFGAPRELAMALRAAAMVNGGGDTVRPLEQAVALLGDTDAKLDRAMVMVELGSALRRCGERVRARECLTDGIDLAVACGGTALARLARQELAATGGRVRSGGSDQLPELTAGERRVAVLAAEGRGNQEIAHVLFVTVKTVEWHLSQAYRKLGIRSRRQLRAALNWDDVERSGVRHPADPGGNVDTARREQRQTLGLC